MKHIIAKKNFEILKNMVSRAKKRHFWTFFAIYSKRDFRITAFIQSRFSLPILRLSTKSFRDIKTNGSGLIRIEAEFLISARISFQGGYAKILAKKM